MRGGLSYPPMKFTQNGFFETIINILCDISIVMLAAVVNRFNAMKYRSILIRRNHMLKVVRSVISFLMVKLMLLTVLLTLIAQIDADAAKRVRVRGYYRKNGTYVKPHYRTVPDGNPYNNYSFPGNYNPNKGTFTTGDPYKYLQRYYAKKRSSSNYSFHTPTYKRKSYPTSNSSTYLFDIPTYKRRSSPSIWSTPNYNYNYSNSTPSIWSTPNYNYSNSTLLELLTK